MRLEPGAPDEEDPYAGLSKMDKVMRRVAIAVAFAGVFEWFFKVVFG